MCVVCVCVQVPVFVFVYFPQKESSSLCTMEFEHAEREKERERERTDVGGFFVHSAVVSDSPIHAKKSELLSAPPLVCSYERKRQKWLESILKSNTQPQCRELSNTKSMLWHGLILKKMCLLN